MNSKRKVNVCVIKKGGDNNIEMMCGNNIEMMIGQQEGRFRPKKKGHLH